MNVKRIVLIGLILVAVAASLSIVAADSSVKVGGIDFNIPGGFTEEYAKDGDAVIDTDDGKVSGTAHMRGFARGIDTIFIMVDEFDSPEDAKKALDLEKKDLNGTSKTLNGHEGMSCYTKDNGVYNFAYCKDKYFILVGSTDESLLESIVPK